MCQNLVPLVNIKIAGKWMFIPQNMAVIGFDPYPFMLGANNPSIVNVVYITVNVSVISGLEYELAMIKNHYSSSNSHGRLFCPDSYMCLN